MAGVKDDDLRAWATNKNWADADAALASHQSLEKMMGGPANELVRIPSDGFSVETNRDLFTRLGMPDKAEGYEFAIPEGMEADQPMQDWARETFHMLGLSTDQGAKLNEAFNERIQVQNTEAHEAHAADVQLGDSKLQKEWGNGYEGALRQGQMATKALGLSTDMVDAIESKIGYEATMKWAANLGAKLTSEDSFELGHPADGGDNDTFDMSPDKARARYQTLLADKEWVKALQTKNHPQHKKVLSERSELFAIIHPEG